MSPAAVILRILIQSYRLVFSPLLAPACRFDPSCSAYALEAVEVHGAVKGSGLALWRVLRCHPWGGWGYDPVPARKTGCGHGHLHDGAHRPERT